MTKKLFRVIDLIYLFRVIDLGLFLRHRRMFFTAVEQYFPESESYISTIQVPPSKENPRNSSKAFSTLAYPSRLWAQQTPKLPSVSVSVCRPCPRRMLSPLVSDGPAWVVQSVSVVSESLLGKQLCYGGKPSRARQTSVTLW